MSLANWISGVLGLGSQDDAARSFRLGESRLCLVDADVTGTHPDHDRARAVAVLPMVGAGFRLSDLAWCPLDGPDGGICAERLIALAGTGPVLTFNPRFVQHMLAAGLKPLGVAMPPLHWLDLAQLLRGVFGSPMGQTGSMTDWCQRLGLPMLREHEAIDDVFNMARMLQMLYARAAEMDMSTLDQLLHAHKGEAWLRGD